jgi:hypothetical protein
MAQPSSRAAHLRTRDSNGPQPLELRFRAVLTEGDARVLFHHQMFSRSEED